MTGKIKGEKEEKEIKSGLGGLIKLQGNMKSI